MVAPLLVANIFHDARIIRLVSVILFPMTKSWLVEVFTNGRQVL